MSISAIPIQCILFLGCIFLCVADPGDGLIRVRGTKFIDRNCQEFIYSGWNSWQLIEAAAGISSALPRDSSVTNGLPFVDYQLDVAKAAGLTVGRFFAHGHHSTVLVLQTSPGVYNERAFVAVDTVLAVAAERGLKMILTFADNWKEIDSKKAYSRWAGVSLDQFYTDATVRDWFKNHIRTVVNRVNSVNGMQYKEDPTIFAWNLMNEPRCDCEVKDYSDSCEKPCADKLQLWIEEMAQFTKEQDPNHLLTVGEEGFYGLESGREGENPDILAPIVDPVEYREFLIEFNLTEDRARWSARSGQDFVRNHNMDSIDYATIHLWPDNWGGVPISFQSRWIESHALDAQRMKKPLVVEEFGKEATPNDDKTRTEIRDPYFEDVYNTFDALRARLPIKGIAFWRFDARHKDIPTTHTVYPTHRIFQNVISPSAQRLKMELRNQATVKNCYPGVSRSYNPIKVSKSVYITAGANLLALDKGEDVAMEESLPEVKSCLRQCERTVGCRSVAYNRNRELCFLKDKIFADDELVWSSEGWQTYWKVET